MWRVLALEREIAVQHAARVRGGERVGEIERVIDEHADLEPEVRSMTGPSFSDGRLFVRNLKQIVALQPK